MKVYVVFRSLNGRNGLVKRLGQFFEQNKDFYIEIDPQQCTKEKVITFFEEFLHLIIRLYSYIVGKKISVLKEHRIVKDIVSQILSDFGHDQKS